jgi:hypothetical protein
MISIYNLDYFVWFLKGEAIRLLEADLSRNCMYPVLRCWSFGSPQYYWLDFHFFWRLWYFRHFISLRHIYFTPPQLNVFIGLRPGIQSSVWRLIFNFYLEKQMISLISLRIGVHRRKFKTFRRKKNIDFNHWTLNTSPGLVFFLQRSSVVVWRAF